MIAPATVIDVETGKSARRERILDAAEVCFVRNGFHRTTMIDLAREAAMSQGNFYRYFPSKEAIVLALAERDHARGAALVAALERTGDLRAVMDGVLARYFTGIARETAVLRLDLWSEATRNPAIAEVFARGEAAFREWLCGVFATLAAAPDCDPAAVFEAIDPLVKAIVVGRALVPDYDASAAAARIAGLIDAGLAGRLPPAGLTAGAGR